MKNCSFQIKEWLFFPDAEKSSDMNKNRSYIMPNALEKSKKNCIWNDLILKLIVSTKLNKKNQISPIRDGLTNCE